MKPGKQRSKERPIKEQSSNSMIERLNLSELDRQLINCTANHQISSSSSSISYGQLYDIAKSIIAIDFEQHQRPSSQDGDQDDQQDEFEKTLTKILQLCQTIIDFLLADVRRLEMERNEKLDDGNQLLQENLKLRKLLQLQQKAIVYRRMSFVSSSSAATSIAASFLVPSTTANGNIPHLSTGTSAATEDDDDNSLNNLDQLPSDRTSTITNPSNNKSTTKLQCPHCSKIFTDPIAFSKHLQLRHLTSNLDDPSLSLSTSLSTNLTIVQRLFQQHCQQQFEQQRERLLQAAAQTSEASTLAESAAAAAAEEKVKHLRTEIDLLREKLSQTELQLQKEKQARETFESDLKQNFQNQIQHIQNELVTKMDQIQQLQQKISFENEQQKEQQQQIKQNNKTNKKNSTKKIHQKSPEKDDLNETNSTTVLSSIHNQTAQISVVKPSAPSVEDESLKSTENIIKNKSNKKSVTFNEDKISVDKEELSSKQNTNEDDNKNDLKQSLRMELITQLTNKRKQNKLTKHSPIEQSIDSSSNSSSTNNSNHSSKSSLLERSLAIDQETNDHLTTSHVVNNDDDNEKDGQIIDKDQTKAEIYQSIEARIKSYLDHEKFDQNKPQITEDGKSILNENVYNQALNRLQQDRSLLIHQSRYDYDFVGIENSIRNMIDTKVMNKIKQDGEVIDETLNQQTQTNDIKSQTIDDKTRQKINVQKQPADNNKENADNSTSQEQKLKTLDQINNEKSSSNNETKNDSAVQTLKSILKKTRKPNENGGQKRNITFNNEVVEFEISPLVSDNEEELDVDVDFMDSQQQPELEIVSDVPTTSSDDPLNRPSMNHQMFAGGEKIFLNDDKDNATNDIELLSSASSSTTSSTTSSDNEEEPQPQKQSKPQLITNNNQPQLSITNQVITIADVHTKQDPQQLPRSVSIPVPAKRNIPNNNNNNNKTTANHHSLDSLLGFEDSVDTKTPKTSSSNERKGVQELAELIEKKLASPARSSLASLTSDTQDSTNQQGTLAHKKLPPLGSLDTKAMMVNLKKQKQQSNSESSSTSTMMSNHHNILDAYDLYEF